MDSKNLMISISGIRGVVGAPDGLTPETALRFAAAFATYCKKGKITLGSDTRPSRTTIIPAVMSGLTGCGLDVVYIGICPTPTVELAVKEMKASGGIVITASHNPIEWNALKMLNSKGMFLSDKEGKEILKIYRSGRFDYKTHKALGNVYDDDFVPVHIDRILRLPAVRVGSIRKRKFKVAIDCVNGAGSMLSPKLLERLGCRVTAINCETSGKFTRGPEPIPKNLRQLSRAVRENGCDIGFAHDPDADRLAIVDENGKPIGEEYTLAFTVDYILSIERGSIAINLSTSRMNDDIAAACGVKCHRTAVGEINVSLQLKKSRGVIGGEGNGGVIYPPLLYGRDGAVGIALILSYMARKKITVSEAVSILPHYIMIKDRIEMDRRTLQKRLPALKTEFKGARVNSLDGIKFDFEDSWIHIRTSNTEPMTRIIAEATTSRRADKLIKKAKSILAG
jgi:phosphomannomutase